MTLANSITLLRVLLVPLFAWTLLYHNESQAEGYTGSGWYWAAVILFAVAALSDGIDGWVAATAVARAVLVATTTAAKSNPFGFKRGGGFPPPRFLFSKDLPFLTSLHD